MSKSPSVIPASFQRESIFRRIQGVGNDRASRMPGKRKDSGFPIKNVGNDSGGGREGKRVERRE